MVLCTFSVLKENTKRYVLYSSTILDFLLFMPNSVEKLPTPTKQSLGNQFVFLAVRD